MANHSFISKYLKLKIIQAVEVKSTCYSYWFLTWFRRKTLNWWQCSCSEGEIFLLACSSFTSPDAHKKQMDLISPVWKGHHGMSSVSDGRWMGGGWNSSKYLMKVQAFASGAWEEQRAKAKDQLASKHLSQWEECENLPFGVTRWYLPIKKREKKEKKTPTPKRSNLAKSRTT